MTMSARAALHVASDDLAEEAAGWVARLSSSDATDGDRAAFDAWVKASPDHAEAYEEMSALWGQMARVPKSVARRRISARGTAALCLAALLAFAVHRGGLLIPFMADYSTGVGITQRIDLDDGSVVTLNTDSAIDVDYSAGTRRIVLLKGEAFFDVAPDRERPFVVEGGDVAATALGTHYGMRLGDETEVAVEEGRVAVTAGADRREVGASEAAMVDGDDRISVGPSPVGDRTSWREGRLVFSNRPLGEVLAELDRYRPGRIVVIGSESAQTPVSGVFDIADTDHAIDTLARGLGLSVSRVPGWMTLVRIP